MSLVEIKKTKNSVRYTGLSVNKGNVNITISLLKRMGDPLYVAVAYDKRGSIVAVKPSASGYKIRKHGSFQMRPLQREMPNGRYSFMKIEEGYYLCRIDHYL